VSAEPHPPAAQPWQVPLRFAALSIAAAAATIALKAVAWRTTGSVGLLSDALESLVNLAGALMALAMLRIAARPADEEHPYGHTKAEYFSSGFEGALILIAAASIAVAAIQRLVEPRPLERIGVGLGVAIVAALLNLAVAVVLLRAGRRHGSIALEASAHHLFTDFWTSVGVVVGVGAVGLTGWRWLDPVVALLVAANIVRTGIDIVFRSALGLMDTGLPAAELERLHAALEPHRSSGVEFHAFRSRRSGTRKFVSFHVLVPGDWTVDRGHELLERIDFDVRAALPNTTVFTHLEPLEDPRAWEDTGLDRPAPP
jgi:cation diffusion facilitator family transporter